MHSQRTASGYCTQSAADLRKPPVGHEAIVDLSKAKELLGWEPEHSWRDL